MKVVQGILSCGRMRPSSTDAVAHIMINTVAPASHTPQDQGIGILIYENMIDRSLFALFVGVLVKDTE